MEKLLLEKREIIEALSSQNLLTEEINGRNYPQLKVRFQHYIQPGDHQKHFKNQPAQTVFKRMKVIWGMILYFIFMNSTIVI